MMLTIAVALLLAGCVVAMGQEPATPEENAVSAILMLGGKVERDEKLPGRPVCGVNLSNTQIKDAGLKELKELNGLEDLDLSCTDITDAGLGELKELKGLRELDLAGTDITDAGLKELKELKDLRELNLGWSRITDAGLKDLEELKGLRTLDITMTSITNAGEKELQQALSKTAIVRDARPFGH